jgi:hypothetical protein
VAVVQVHHHLLHYSAAVCAHKAGTLRNYICENGSAVSAIVVCAFLMVSHKTDAHNFMVHHF